MAIDVGLELYAHRSVQERLKGGVGSVLLLHPGMRRQAPETAEEWIVYDPLAIEPFRGRRGTWSGVLLFQVVCFSRFEKGRADHATDAHFRLAGVVRQLLEKVDVPVTTIGSSSETFLGALQVGEAAATVLSEGALAYGGLEGVPSPPNNVHAVALTFRGVLSSG